MRQNLQRFWQGARRRHRRSIYENRDHADFSIERGLDLNAYQIACIVGHPRQPVPAHNQDDSFNFSGPCLESVREIDATPEVARTQAALQLIANSRRPGGILGSKAYEDGRRHANIPDLEYLTSALRQRKPKEAV